MKDEINITKEILEKGGIILYPTDTIWGVGCDALNEKAVRKVYRLKKRKADKSCIILVDSLEMLAKYVSFIPEKAFSLIKEDFERPFTIIYPKAKNLPESVLAADGSVAVRVVKTGFSAALIKELGKPIISTSANLSGEPYPKAFIDIHEDVKSKVDKIVDPKFDSSKGHTSKIVKFDESSNLEVIRE